MDGLCRPAARPGQPDCESGPLPRAPGRRLAGPSATSVS